MYNKGPFADWVPKPLMLLLIMFFLFTMIAVSGVYTGIASEISSAKGFYGEFIGLANNAGSIGMAIALAIILRVKMRFRSKEIITTSAIALAVLSYLCTQGSNPWLLVACSFFIGFFKMFPLIEMVLPVMFILSPTGDRGKFYAIFYPISISCGQVSAYYFTKMAFNGSWESPYLFMSALMLVVAALSIIFQHNQRFSFKMPLYQIDWLSLLLLSISFMLMNYGLIFMKQQNWFHSASITFSLLLGVLLFIFVVLRQKGLKRKLIDFRLLLKYNVYHSLVLLVFLGIYLASSSLFTQYTVGILGYNNLVNAGINLWMIPGVFLAGVYAFFSFKYKWPIKYFILVGFLAFAAHSALLYFMISPQMDIRYLEYANIVKGFGMGVLFIGIWFYCSLGLGMEVVLGIMTILLAVRSFLATAIGSALIGWASYQAQWQSISDLSVHIDLGNIAAGASTYPIIVQNSIMASAKIVFGCLIWLIIPISMVILGHSYGSFTARRLVIFRKKIRGSSSKGYRLS